LTALGVSLEYSAVSRIKPKSISGKSQNAPAAARHQWNFCQKACEPRISGVEWLGFAALGAPKE
jgi:hypothetical protein